jgi:hypothetical protein
MSVEANKELVRRYFEEAPGHPEVYADRFERSSRKKEYA